MRFFRVAAVLAALTTSLPLLVAGSVAAVDDSGVLSGHGHGRPSDASTQPSSEDDDRGMTDEEAVTAGKELAQRLSTARVGETIVVGPGRYTGNFVLPVPATLVGEGRPVLDGGGVGTVLEVPDGADGTVVRGLRLIASGPGPFNTPSGMRIEASNVLVEDVEVADSYMGIQVMGGSNVRLVGNRVESFADGAVDNELHATGGEVDATGTAHSGHDGETRRLRGDAVTLWNATAPVVEGNVIDHARDGIYLSFAADAVIRDNEVRNSRYAIHGMAAVRLVARSNYFAGNLAGAILMYGGPFEIIGNTILESGSPATGFGLVLKDGAGATIAENVIVANRVGIKLDNGGATSSNTGPATIRGNTIGMNQIGVEIMSASRGYFSANSFVENTVQAVTDGPVPNLVWTLDGRGNFWSNYRGYDADGDGIGDVPFVQGGSIANTLTRSPVMISLASGPGFRLLQAIEDRWAPEHPVVVDPHPLISMESPVVPEALRPKSAPVWFSVVGGVAAVAAALALLAGRRTRKVRHV